MPHPVDYGTIPACEAIYCHPEIAWVGMTEQEAKKQNIPTRIGTFLYGYLRENYRFRRHIQDLSKSFGMKKLEHY